MEKFKHFSLYERQRIEKYLREKESLRFIAAKLGRSVSSISKEIEINNVKGIYDAVKAQAKARLKRRLSKIQCLTVVMDSRLRKFVVKNIEADQSPEGISGRLRRVERKIPYASPKAIYKFVASPYGRQIEKHLYTKSIKKKGGPKNKKPVAIDGRTMIDKRPKKVAKRRQFGHFEADFIESGTGGKGCLLVLVERKTRYPFLQYAEDRTTGNINRAIAGCLAGVPVLSLTVDNDLSFQKHRELSKMIGAAVFFCHPQNPQEKPTVENRNKSLRRYFPKRSDLSRFSLADILTAETKLRSKFMKCPNYQTPQEAWDKEMARFKDKKIPFCGIIGQALKVNSGCSD